MALKYEFVTRSGGPAKHALKKFMDEVRKEIAEAKILLPERAMDLADQAGRFMAQRVRLMTKRKGATGDLAAALESSALFRRSSKNGFTIGIGNKAKLPEYWAMINYGGYISSKSVPGFWTDTPGGASNPSKKKGDFAYVQGGGAEFGYMHPVKPIKGFQYIAYAHVRMLSYVRNRFDIRRK